MQSFTYAEYLSLALAKVWDNKAKLPSTKTMWDLHQKRVDDFGGYGKHFQYLGSLRTHGQCRVDVICLTYLKYVQKIFVISLAGSMTPQSNMEGGRFVPNSIMYSVRKLIYCHR